MRYEHEHGAATFNTKGMSDVVSYNTLIKAHLQAASQGPP